MKTQEQIDARDRKELAQRKKQKNKKALKYGLLLTLLALFLASVTDEISSAIGVQVQSSVVTEFFVRPLNVPYNEAMAMFSTATTFSYALMALVPFYKALADKFGRKPFLVLNTLGMGVGMALAWWSPNMVLYFIGYGMTVFFVQHDMQIVYLYEIVPKERRATIYGLIKGISTLGVVLIPMLRSSVMGTDTTLWRGVYFLPALIAIAVSVFSLVVTRESKTFLDQRISYLESPYELRHPEVKKLSREEEKAQKAEVKQHKTGVFHALGHLFKNKQLFWLAMVSSAFALGSTTISGFSESIMTDFGMTSEAVNEALLLLSLPVCRIDRWRRLRRRQAGQKDHRQRLRCSGCGRLHRLQYFRMAGSVSLSGGYFLRPVSGLLVDYPGLCWHDGCRICSHL